jgi:signal transduction histidine kinase/signal recognition particle receptor subunit beta/ActR/RegA family two-component response regulator
MRRSSLGSGKPPGISYGFIESRLSGSYTVLNRRALGVRAHRAPAGMAIADNLSGAQAMAEVNPRDRFVKIKIVYYGPALGGKTTNLQVLHRNALAGRRGELISINSFQDRTILFDLLPVRTVDLKGFNVHMQLVAVPGQAMYAATRRATLKGVDGVVFVANSASDRWDENLRSLKELQRYLTDYQIDPFSIPLIVQFNKRDLASTTPLEVMDRHLNARREEAFPSVATRGQGLVETLRAALGRTIRDISKRFRALDMPQGLTADGWARQVVMEVFGRESFSEKRETPGALKRTAPPEFGLADEFEFEPDASALETVPAGARTIRIPVAQSPSEPNTDACSDAILASATEACARLALDLTEAQTERDLSRAHLDDIRSALSKAHAMSDGEAKDQLRRILDCLGDQADATHAAVALWNDARRAEAELDRQRQALRQSERLAAMGTLVAGVAHELNNPLYIITGQLELARRESPTDRILQRLDKIRRAADRCARIVRNFLALARQHPQERKLTSLNRVIEEAVELFSYGLRADGVELQLALARNLPEIWADPHELHQVVVNLITNAQQALRGKNPPRRITISTQPASEGSRIRVLVSDNGPGIPEDVQGRIFEPFFTTKAPGEGTGLGLSLCHGIVQSHAGALRVHSVPGHGATFLVDLPTGKPAAACETDAVAPLVRSPLGLRVLVVDDEPDVAGTLADLLAADGHRVETAENGALALAALKSREFDLIVSDLRMPGMDGAGLFRSVERRHPELKSRFIFFSGDSIDPANQAFLDERRLPCVGKPFNFGDIRRVISGVVGATPTNVAGIPRRQPAAPMIRH